MKTTKHLVAYLLIASAAIGVARGAVVISPDNLVPYTTYRSVPGTVLDFSGTWVRNFVVQSPTQRVVPPPTGTVVVNSFWDIWTEISIDSGLSWEPVHDSHGTFWMNFLHTGSVGPEDTYGSTVSAWASGAVGESSQLRLAAGPASTGSTTVEPVESSYMIDSFFDVFLENYRPGSGTWAPVTAASSDGGATWTTGLAAVRLESIPESAATGLALLGVLLVAAWRRPRG